MTKIQKALGRDFQRYAATGQNAYFMGERIVFLDTRELLAVIGWMMESNQFWREQLSKKLERK
jgi:hypothetical protein